MKYLYTLSLFLAATIVNANNSNPVSIPTQTNIKISVMENVNNYEWSLICNPNGETNGNHPEKEAVCSAIEQLQVPLDEAIKNAQPDGACTQIYEPVKLAINGIVDGKEVQVVKEFSNSCVMNLTLTAAGIPKLLPINQDGTYNVDNN
ncbi:hypothetical protein BDC45DRAFT_495521 [Circinella umbellata]|nr:hypothetical protein BDC45DRAFT_495521 [Circinella umbellata]